MNETKQSFGQVLKFTLFSASAGLIQVGSSGPVDSVELHTEQEIHLQIRGQYPRCHGQGLRLLSCVHTGFHLAWKSGGGSGCQRFSDSRRDHDL